MSSTLAAAKPISANVSRAASSSRSTVSVRRRLGRCTSADVVTMQYCIGYTAVSKGAVMAIPAPACGRRTVRDRHPGQASAVSNAARLLPGVFIGSHAVAAGVLTEKQLRRRGYRRLVHGVYAAPGLPLDHRLRCRGV